ncbi:hypothetical protein M1105_07950 [Limibaculum sp. FT325]|uniref:hypothetical protein n=1 Tax=Thermohalobaculum sediminis TaxID=2939436 RepID=UPI0020BDFE4D|nr:hypothetical protein [Limibaculum sediminis]MCL5776915.1 hypothetical protein [Limibaculum sediminis]
MQSNKVVWLGLAILMAGCGAGEHKTKELSKAFAPTPETRTLERALPPTRAPSADEFRSMTVVSLLDGRSERIRITPFGNGVRIREESGCISTRVLDWFSPSDSYANCGTSKDWHTASGTVRVIDDLYPLTVGSTGRYERRAVSHTGKVSTRETRCEVTDAVEVQGPGKHARPAYVVTCDDGRVRRTTWYAPGTGPVAYREDHHEDGVREAWVRAD